MPIALAYITGVLALLFGASLVEQYLSRRQPYHLFWAVGFLLFSAAMGLWFLRETFGLNEWLFRIWYITGPTLAAAYLGTGMIFMMASRKVAVAFLGYLAIVTLAAFIMILAADFRSPGDCIAGLTAAQAGVGGLDCMQPGDTLTRMAFFPSEVRILTGILNLYGGLAILAGAIWSLSNLGRRDADSRGSTAASLPQGDSASNVMGRMMGAMNQTMKGTGLGMKVLLQNKDFWRRDESVQLSASTIIMTMGIAIAGLALTMNSVGGSSTHLALFLTAILMVYGGILASKENFDTLPHTALMETIRLVRGAGGASAVAVAVAEPAGPTLIEELVAIQNTPDGELEVVEEEETLDDEEPVAEATIDQATSEVEVEEQATTDEPVSEEQADAATDDEPLAEALDEGTAEGAEESEEQAATDQPVSEEQADAATDDEPESEADEGTTARN